MKNVPAFCGVVQFISGNVLHLTENGLIMMGQDIIKELEPNNFYDKSKIYLDSLVLSSDVKNILMTIGDVKELVKHTTDEEKRKFIENHYNIWNILDKKLEWGNKKEKYIRDIYDILLKDVEPPKIK